LATIKHQCVINIILILDPKHSTTPATRKKINSIPTETRTLPKEVLYGMIGEFCSLQLWGRMCSLWQECVPWNAIEKTKLAISSWNYGG